MKSVIARWLVVAFITGAVGCKKPVYHADQAESTAPQEAQHLSRDEILAIRTENTGRTYADLQINGTSLGESKIVAINDYGVRVQNRSGFNDFTWADLPADLREIWGHDPNAPSPGLAAAKPAYSTYAAQAELRRYKEQIDKLKVQIRRADTVVTEAETFQKELAAVYEEEDEKAAERVYARMAASSCSS